MAIGIDGTNEFDDFDDLDYEGSQLTPEDTTTQDTGEPQEDPVEEPQQDQGENDDFISQLLKSRGIEDKTKIKFENDEGVIEEYNWDDLSNEDRLNVLSTSSKDLDNELDDSEIQLISAIRKSGMTPAEYIQFIEQSGVDRYIQNNNEDSYSYQVDQYTDDDLYVYDLMSRTGITEEEAREALERVKSNEALFSKQIGAIRNEYKEAEKEQLQIAQAEQDQLAQERYDQFSQSIAEQINDFKHFSGYDIDMDNEEMTELYEFITGFDAAGNNHFAKALADPKVVVQMAWFALNGPRLINDITEYYQKEITNVGRESYAKGVADTQKKKDKPSIVIKDPQVPKRNQVHQDFDDLDDFN